jgi:uncharacterized protein with PIN domain
VKVRFLADENLDERIVSGVLRWEPTVDFLTAARANLLGLPDLQVLEFAANEGRILVTHDRKTMPYAFGELLAKRESPGVIILSKDLLLKRSIDESILVWAASQAEQWVGMLTQINH